MLLGNNGGVYLVINKINKETLEILNYISGCIDFIRTKTNEQEEICLGKGSFGRVKIGICIIPPFNK